eukprot:12417158-Alexandrium_andersonii.AAC.1
MGGASSTGGGTAAASEKEPIENPKNEPTPQTSAGKRKKGENDDKPEKPGKRRQKSSKEDGGEPIDDPEKAKKKELAAGFKKLADLKVKMGLGLSVAADLLALIGKDSRWEWAEGGKSTMGLRRASDGIVQS